MHTHIGIVAHVVALVYTRAQVKTLPVVLCLTTVALTSGSFGCVWKHCSALRRASSVFPAYKGMKHLKEGGGRREGKGEGGGGKEAGGKKEGERGRGRGGGKREVDG